MIVNRISLSGTYKLFKRFDSSSAATAAPSSLHLKAINAVDTTAPGHIHSKQPFRYNCKEGRIYMWCTCGWSRTQPFCDATHANPKLKIKNRPYRFACTETKDYWFCQCKQTKNRPFCDGSHKLEEVEKEKVVTIQHKY